MVGCVPTYFAAGANRHPAAADWDASSGLLAFGSDRNIGLWEPLVFESLSPIVRFAHSVDRMMIFQAYMHYCEAIQIQSMLSNSFEPPEGSPIS